MIHQVTVFFPPPGVRPGKARAWLLWHTRFMREVSFGSRGRAIVPHSGFRIRTKQKNYLWTEASIWKELKHEKQARRHMPSDLRKRRMKK